MLQAAELECRQFGTSTLQADTAAIESSSSGDSTYTNTVSQLQQLEQARDQLGTTIKTDLDKAAFHNRGIQDTQTPTDFCQNLIAQANQLAGSH